MAAGWTNDAIVAGRWATADGDSRCTRASVFKVKARRRNKATLCSRDDWKGRHVMLQEKEKGRAAQMR